MLLSEPDKIWSSL